MEFWRKKIYTTDGGVKFISEDGKTLLDVFKEAYLDIRYYDDIEKIDIYKLDKLVATVYK